MLDDFETSNLFVPLPMLKIGVTAKSMRIDQRLWLRFGFHCAGDFITSLAMDDKVD